MGWGNASSAMGHGVGADGTLMDSVFMQSHMGQGTQCSLSVVCPVQGGHVSCSGCIQGHVG